MKLRDRIKEFRRVNASEILPNPANWRTHPQAQQDALRGVLAEVGIADALLVRETPAGLMLIDGHLRADTAPDTEWPVLVLDVDDAEAAKLLATVDPLAAMAETDSAKLDELLREIDTGSEALQAMLAELADDAGLYKTPEVTEDEVPEPPADPVTKPGDLWLLGEHRLLCGDSTKAEDVGRVLCGAPINLAFTSPPYASQRKYDESSGFKPIPPDEYVDWWESIQNNVKANLSKDGSFFVNIKAACLDGERLPYVLDLVLAHKRRWGWRYVEEFAWTHSGTPGKPTRRFKNQFEPVHQFAVGEYKFRPDNATHQSEDAFSKAGMGNVSKQQGKGGVLAGVNKGNGLAYPGNVISCGKNTESLGHDAAFPVGLPGYFIRAFTDQGDSIYEPFCGSGTTLIAAEQLGRRCYGMEISPAYCDVIVARWEKLTGKKAELESR